MDAKVRDELKAQYPNDRLYPITSEEDGIRIVVKAAEPALYLKYRSQAGDFSDPVKRVMAEEMLVLGCIVFPDRDKFEDELKERRLTGFYRKAADFITQITGNRDTVKLGEVL